MNVDVRGRLQLLPIHKKRTKREEVQGGSMGRESKGRGINGDGSRGWGSGGGGLN